MTVRPARRAGLGAVPDGRIEVHFACDAEKRTYVRRQFANYPFHICPPHAYPGDPDGMVTLYLQSLSGGVYEGDRLTAALTAEAGARAHVTSQAATVVRGMQRDSAEIDVAICAGPSGLIEFVPDATILFPGARLTSRVRVTAPPDATVVVGDSILCHDPAGRDRCFDWYRGELVYECPDGDVRVRDRYTARGKEVAAGTPGTCGPHTAIGSIYVFGQRAASEAMVEALRGATCLNGVYAGASLLPNGAGAWARMLAADGAALKAAMLDSWSAARETLLGRRPEPRRK